MKRVLLSLLLWLPVLAHSQNGTGLFKNQTLTATFLERGIISQTVFNSDGSSLLFASGPIKNSLEANLKNTRANFTTEVAYFEPADYVTNRPSNLAIYQQLNNIALLEKVLVRPNRGNPKPLFRNIQLYTDSTFSSKLTNPTPVTSILPKVSYFVSLKEDTLGNLRFQIDIIYTNGTFQLTFTNLETAKTLGQKVADAGELTITYIIQPLDSGFLHIAQVAAQIENIEKAQKNIDLATFFSRRIEAIKGWFFKEILNTPISYGRTYWRLIDRKL